MVNQSLLDDFDELFPQEKVKWDDVVIKDKLGEGGQAPVFKCEYNNSNYAVKFYDVRKCCKRNSWSIEEFLKSMENELRIGRKVKKTISLMKTYGYTYKKINGSLQFMILMELLVCSGDLSKYIADEKWWIKCYMCDGKLKPIPITQYVYYNKDEDIHWCYKMPLKHKIQIVCSLIKSVKELHSKGIIHCDIKTENIVLHYGPNRQVIKLIDFDNSCIVDGDFEYESSPATMGYCSPEQHNYRVSDKSDIYSLGVVITEVWNGEIWYDGESYEECLKEVKNGIKKIEETHQTFGKLIRKCLSEDEDTRPYADKLLNDFYKIKF